MISPNPIWLGRKSYKDMKIKTAKELLIKLEVVVKTNSKQEMKFVI
jgi:hypothetical protein